MAQSKTFTLLSQIPKAVIGKCSAILPNRMQCWRAGEVLVHTVEQGTNPEEPNKTFDYQLCRSHAVIEDQEYQAESKKVQAEGAVADDNSTSSN